MAEKLKKPPAKSSHRGLRPPKKQSVGESPLLGELHLYKQLFLTLLDNIPDSIYFKNKNAEFVYVSKSLANLFSTTSEAAIGKTDFDFFLKELAEEKFKDDMQVIKTGIPVINKEEIDKTNLVERWVSTTKLPWYDEDRNIIGMFGISRDITERKQAEKALKFIRFALDNATDSMVTIGKDGRFIDVNDAFCLSMGYSREELLSMSVHDMDPNHPAEIWPEFWEKLKKSGSLAFESHHRTKEGKVFPVEITASFFEYNGKEYHCGFARDITERKRAEEILRILSARNEAILASVPDIIMEVDMNKVYTWANTSGRKFFGEDVIGKEASYYFEGEQDTYTIVQPLFYGKEDVFYVESWQRRQDREKRLLAWWCKVIKDEHGTVTGALSTARDITEHRRTEEALRESEIHFKALYQNNPIPTFTWQKKDDDFVLVDYNNSAKVITEGKVTEFIGRSAHEMYKDRPDIVQSLQQCLSEKEIIIREKISEHFVPGRLIVVIFAPVPPDIVMVHLEDITERRQAEDALSKERNLLRTLTDNLPDYIFVKDTESRFITTNSAHLKTLGAQTLDEIIGKTDFDFFPRELAEEYHADEQEVIRSGQPLINREEVVIDQRNVRKWFLTSKVPLHDKTGSVIGIVGISHDITEHKNAEEEVESAKKRLENSINVMSDIFCVLDLNGSLTLWNKATEKISGYTHSEVSKMNAVDFFPEEQKQIVTDAIVKAFKEGYSSTDLDLFTKDKKIISHHFVGSRWENEKGETVGVVVIGRDITERKELQSQLTQSLKMESVGRLAGGVAHDFNNMLQTILGNTDLILHEIGQDSPFYEDLNEVKTAARRSADLTRQLLAFARKQNVTPKVLNLNDTILDMLKMLQRLIGEDINLSWLPAQDLYKVKIDPSQIDQILANLMVNARDAIAGGGKVTIETKNQVFDKAYCSRHRGFIPGEYVMLAVSDNGCGMEKDIISNIFEPFFTTKEIGEGTGLGLSTVYGIVKQNNGFINVYSEPGQGTTFRIYLPCVKTEHAEVHVEIVAEKIQGGTETILIIDDEQAILNTCKRILKRLGYTVLTANTPGDAIRLAEEHTGKIHLLITDVIMPNMNGRELAERIALIKPGIKYLYMSGYTDNAIAHRGVLEEGVQFVEKPFSNEDLATKIRQVLKGK